MKKLFMVLLIALSVVALASCSLGGLGSGGGLLPDSGDVIPPNTDNTIEQIPDPENCKHDGICFADYYEIAATCTAAGSYGEKIICCNCGAEINTEELGTIQALGHDVDNHKAKTPTCTEIGWDAYETCERDGCDYSTYEGKEKPALDHDLKNHEAKAPTCTEIGWDAYVTCKRDGCDYSTYKEKSLLGHDLENHEAQAPTCTEIGKDLVTCKRNDCDYSSYADKDALGHSYVDNVCVRCKKLKPSEGLTFVSNNDGTCYVSAANYCTDKYIVIPEKSPAGDSVTEIGENAFYNRSNLTGITIPDSVTTIGGWAFRGCKSLTSVVIPDSVTKIGAGAFFDCYKLVEVINMSSLDITAGNVDYGYVGHYAKEVHTGESKIVNKDGYLFYSYNDVNYLLGYVGSETEHILPKSFNDKSYEIYPYAFYNRITFKSVEISDNVTTIGGAAFYGCKSLTSIVIPDSVTSIGYCAFEGCDSLTSVVIPDSVTEIGGAAFSYCTGLTSITIPNSITSIGTNSFYDCILLTSVVIPASVTTIGYQAFYNCSALTSVVIPDSITSIGDYAFQNCTALEEIFFNATSMSDFISSNNVFYNAGTNGNGIKVVIGANVTKIPAYLFCQYSSSNSPKITGIEFEEGCVCESIGSDAFRNCSNLTSVVIPDSITTIGDSAFYGCNNIVSATIPALAISSIPKTNLATVTITSGESIGEKAFYQCKSLVSVVIHSGITNIGKDAFYDCNNIVSATIPALAINSIPKSKLETVIITSGKSIVSSAFKNCTSLASVVIPDSVTTIGNGAFYNCTALEEIYFNATSMSDLSSSNEVFYNAGKNGNGIKVVIGANVTKIPAYLFDLYNSSSNSPKNSPKITSVEFEKGSVCESIGYFAFRVCRSLTSIEIPDSVTTIGDYAFKNSGLTSVTIPDSVTSIGDGAFNYCISLKSVVIGDSITTIGSSAFYDCIRLESVVIGNSLTTIGDYAFYNCDSLTSVVIPNRATTIGKEAFRDCYSLKSVVIPDSVSTIGDYAFFLCPRLTSITVSDANGTYKSIDGNLYSADGETLIQYATGKTEASFTVPDSVTTIGNGAFEDCIRLTNVAIPNSVTTIADGAFRHCSLLTSVVIPDSVTKIGDYAFYDCGNLKSITIGNNVTTIGSHAFYLCNILTSVAIGDKVTKIGDYAFYHCTNLTNIKYRGTKEAWNAIKKGSRWDLYYDNDYAGGYRKINYTITYNYDGE